MTLSDENKYIVDGFIQIFHNVIANMNRQLFDYVPHVTIEDIKIVEPSSDDINYYLNKSGTCQSIVRIWYSVNLEGKSVKQQPIDFKIPMLIQGIYIYEGATKLPLNRVINDNECLIQQNKIYLNQDTYISVNSGLKMRVEDKKFEVVDYETVDPSLLKISDYTAKKLFILFNLDEIPQSFNKSIVDKIQQGLKSDPNLS